MRHRSLLILTSVLTTGALTLTACGTRSSGSSTSGKGGTTVTIGVDAPLTGSLSAMGQGIKNSADLATRIANQTNEVPGVTFKVEALDDQAQPSSGQQNATKLVADSSVLGVVGPLNSAVAQSMQKVFDEANLTEVSPANTAVSLTQGPDWASGKKVRQFTSYFRTATTDAVQGPFGAEYAYNTDAKRKVFLVDDKQAYGVGLVATFQSEFTKLGGKVAGQDHVAQAQKDFSTVVARIKASGADMVYYGGQYPEAGPLSAQLKSAGVNIPLMGGDGIKDDTYIKLAGSQSNGDAATLIGAPVETLASAKKFISDYKAAGYSDPYAAYGGYSYDSAWAIIEAVKAVVNDNGGKLPSDARAKVEAAMSKVSFSGVTGQVAFDQYGDATNKQLTVYVVKNGQWVAVKSGTYTG